MKQLHPFLSLFLLVLSVFSCEKDNLQLEGRQNNQSVVVPLSYEVLVQEPDTNYQIGFSLEEEDVFLRQIMAVGSITQDETGPLLYLGVGKLPENSTSPERFVFSLRFRAEGLDPAVSPDDSTFRDYFPDGKEFSFGSEAGAVQLGMLLPTTDLFGERSQSAFLESPQGTVRVESIETFLAPIPEREGGEKEYLMITFSFNGEVGIHDRFEASRAERNGEMYLASEVAQVSGTATLVLAATPG